jgi:hypothetical protein
MRFELMTPSLPRKCSTPELHRLITYYHCAFAAHIATPGFPGYFFSYIGLKN